MTSSTNQPSLTAIQVSLGFLCPVPACHIGIDHASLRLVRLHLAAGANARLSGKSEKAAEQGQQDRREHTVEAHGKSGKRAGGLVDLQCASGSDSV
jgi:hypothetical protein